MYIKQNFVVSYMCFGLFVCIYANKALSNEATLRFKSDLFERTSKLTEKLIHIAHSFLLLRAAIVNCAAVNLRSCDICLYSMY